MSKEAISRFGAKIGSSAYWSGVNRASGLCSSMDSRTNYQAMLQELGIRASSAIEEIYEDLETQGSKIRYIPSSERNALANQVEGLYDVCKMAGASSRHSGECIQALNLSIMSPWSDPFRDERAIDNAISLINRQRRYSTSETIRMLQEAAKWSVSFVAGADDAKKEFLDAVLQGKDNSFLKNVADEYESKNAIQSFNGRCGYSVGSRSYLQYVETKVFGGALSVANSATFGSPSYETAVREALNSVVEQLERDLEDAARQNDYITDETVAKLKSVADNLNACGVNVGFIHQKIDRLSWFVGGDEHEILRLQRALNRFGNNLTEDGVFGSKTLNALNDFYDELVRGTFPTLAWIDPLQSKATGIEFQRISTDSKKYGTASYASFHDTSSRSHNIKNGVNRGVTVFRADYDDALLHHINTVEGRSIKNGLYMPDSELQRNTINRVNHIQIDDDAYRVLKDFDVYAKKVRVAGRVLAVTGAALDVLEIAQAINIDKNDADQKIGKTTYSAVASIGGSWALGSLGAKGGAVLGAAIGTAILPGIGTAVGGAVGGLVLGIVGSYSGSKLGEYIIDVTVTE